MNHYNTLVKIFKSPTSKSLRIIKFPEIRKIATSDEERKQLNAYRLSWQASEAELQAAAQSNNERDYKQEASARAKRTIKEIIRANYSDRLKMITFTYFHMVQSREAVLSDIKTMAKRYFREYGKHLRYIATIEWQVPRNCLHVHMIIDAPYIRNTTWQEKIWTLGHTWINTISYNKKFAKCLTAIQYVMKYISKDFDSADYYNHLYFRSKYWKLDIERYYEVTGDNENLDYYAHRILGTSETSMSIFNAKLWNDEIITVYDYYVDT